MKKYIAERKLLFSLKGEPERNEFVIRISEPYQVEQSMVDFPIGEGLAGCSIDMVGLPDKEHDLYGVDSVQALNLATNLEPLLERLQRKYDLYWLSGDPYFESEEV